MQLVKLNFAIIIFLFLGSLAFSQTRVSNDKGRSSSRDTHIIISGFIDPSVKLSDTITLEVWRQFASNEKLDNEKHEIKKSLFQSGHFSFNISNITGPVYFSLSNYKSQRNTLTPILSYYVASPGDRVYIDLTRIVPVTVKYDTGMDLSEYKLEKIVFKGKGSPAYTCQKRLRQEYDEFTVRIAQERKTASGGKIHRSNDSVSQFDNQVLFTDEMVANVDDEMDILNEYKSSIGLPVFQLLKANLIGDLKYKLYYDFQLVVNFFATKFDSMQYVKFYRDTLTSIYPDSIQDDIKAMSRSYINAILLKTELDKYYFGVTRPIYQMIKNTYKGSLRSKLLTVFLIDNFDRLRNGISQRDDALKILQSPYLRDQLILNTKHLITGKPAFPFSLYDSAGKNVRLEDFKNKVVFMDFWFVGCGGCEQFFRDDLSKVEYEYKDNPNVVFITVNPDNRENWLKWLKTGIYASDLSINLNAGKTGFGNPVIKYYNIVSYPRPILIDKKGKIFCMDDSILRYKDQLKLKIVEALSL